jgi:hypothetical protein
VAATSMAPAVESTYGLTGYAPGVTRSTALEPLRIRRAAVMVGSISSSGTACCDSGVARPDGCAAFDDGVRSST